MSSSKKARQTMAKHTRERAVKERRERKLAKKEERKLANLDAVQVTADSGGQAPSEPTGDLGEAVTPS